MSHFSADMAAAHLHGCNASRARCTYARRITFNIQSVSSRRAPTPHLQYDRLSSFCTWGGRLIMLADVRWRRARRAPFLSLHLGVSPHEYHRLPSCCNICCAEYEYLSVLSQGIILQAVVHSPPPPASPPPPPPLTHSSATFYWLLPRTQIILWAPSFCSRGNLWSILKIRKKKYEFLSRIGIMTRTEEQNQLSGVPPPPARKRTDGQTDLWNVIFIVCVPKCEICRQRPSVFFSLKDFPLKNLTDRL